MREGLKLKFKSLPPLSKTPRPVTLPSDTQKRDALMNEVDSMLKTGAIEKVNNPDPSLYSHLFMVKKKSGGLCPIIDLKALNKHLSVPHFQMESAQSIRAQLQLGENTVSLDMKDAYFHTPIHPQFRRYMRFAIGNQVYQFHAMCFGLALAPFVFIKILRSLAEYLRKEEILIHFYLDDWIIRAKLKKLLISQANRVMSLARKLCIIINITKSNLIPQSRFIHLGIDIDLIQGLAFPTQEILEQNKAMVKVSSPLQESYSKSLSFFSGTTEPCIRHGSTRQTSFMSSPVLSKMLQTP